MKHLPIISRCCSFLRRLSQTTKWLITYFLCALATLDTVVAEPATPHASANSLENAAIDAPVEQLNSLMLMTAAASARSSGEGEEATFLRLVGRARYLIDKQVYPPKGKGGNSPGVLMASLASGLSQSRQSIDEMQPEAMLRIAERLTEWSPAFPEGYDPGWKYDKTVDVEGRSKIVKTSLEKMASALRQKSRLLSSEDYQKFVRRLADLEQIKSKYYRAQERVPGDGPVPPKLVAAYESADEELPELWVQMRELEWLINPESRWHHQVGWQAEDFFEDPRVIDLCHAIERNDVAEMERLIALGVDVNTIGNHGVTLLLWAMPDGKLERFECLLRHGANPNVTQTTDFGKFKRGMHYLGKVWGVTYRGFPRKGIAVTHLACTSPLPQYVRLIFSHGGDANLIYERQGENSLWKEVPLNMVFGREIPNTHERVAILLNQGADPDYRQKEYELTPVMKSVERKDYGTALLLLKNGADYSIARRQNNYSTHLTKEVLRDERYLPFEDAKKATEYRALIDWLVEHGAPFEKARNELDRDIRPWGKEARRLSEIRKAKAEASWEAIKQERRERLAEIAEEQSRSFESAADWVAKLTDKERADAAFAKDHEGAVLVLDYRSPLLRRSHKETIPWLTLYANGKIRVRHRLHAKNGTAEDDLTAEEFTWLVHLANNCCSEIAKNPVKYELQSTDAKPPPYRCQFPAKNKLNDTQFYFKAPYRKTDFANTFGPDKDSFSQLISYTGFLVRRTLLGDANQRGKILAAVNEEFLARYPDYPSYSTKHLERVTRKKDGHFDAVFFMYLDYSEDDYIWVRTFITQHEKKTHIHVKRPSYGKKPYTYY